MPVGCRPTAAAGVLLAGLAATAWSEQLNFTSYTNVQGLPQQQALALAQDAAGYIWAGTYGGVSRYDGASFRTLRTADGLSANGVRDLVPAEDGRLWVGTLGGGVCTVENGRVTGCLEGPEQLVSDYVTDLEPDPRGGLWVATDVGVTHRAADGTVRHFGLTDGLPSERVWSLRYVAGRLLACTARGLAEYGEGRFAPLQVPGLEAHSLRAVAESDGELIVGAEDGLFRIRRGRLERVRVPGLAGPGPFVTDMARDGDVLWIATRSGVLRLDAEGGLRRLTTGNGLLSDIVHRVLVDREGNLWFGTDDGLSKLVPGPIGVWTRRDGLPHPFVRAMAQDARGRLWFGTRDGIAILEAGRFAVVEGGRLPGRRVYSLAPLADGTMLAGTTGGLVQLDGTRILGVWRQAQGLPDDFAIAAVPTRDGRGAWIGTSAGTVIWRDGRLQPAPGELAKARPMAMCWGPSGRLWLGLRAGGVLVTDGREVVLRLGKAEGLTDQVIWSLDQDGEAVWVGSNGDGAFRVTREGIERLDTGKGLVDDFVWEVLCDSRGGVWFYTSRGLDRLEKGRIRHFGHGDGLADLEGVAGAALEDRRGVLWFASGRGLVRFDPKEERPMPPPPDVVLEAVVSSRRGPVAPGARLAPPTGVLSFAYTALTFRDEKAVRFRHRLLPVESEWSEAEADHTVRLASIGAGRYRFEVLAENPDGVRSRAPAGFEFTVLAPWWQRPLALALWAVVLALAVAGWVRWRTARLERERRRLERLVAERTEEIARHAEEMRHLAATDELTGVANRRHFIDTLRSELQRLSRSPEDARLALLVMDLDGFKQINDTWGHNVGDAVLRSVAQALLPAVRETDLVARFGGDEFAVILPMTGREGAMRVAQKLLQAVRSVEVDTGFGKRARVTASMGMAVVAPSAVFEAVQVTQLIQRADAALYGAKRAGGDRALDDLETWA